MNLQKLKIRNIRGITRLDLAPNGETIAIIGNNGTGKSAVVDAIDFLLTGDMARLTGRRGISVQRHGKHVKAKPEECFVEAEVSVPGITDPVPLRRSFKNPDVLDVPAEVRARLAPFLAAAEQRQYVLTREDILKFISARPQHRAALVQAVLNLDRVEDLRQTLTTAGNSEKSRLQQVRANRVAAEGAARDTLELVTWSDQLALKAVNKLRKILGGAPINTLADLKKDLIPPGVLTTETVAKRPTTQPDPIGDIVRVGKSVSAESETQLDSWDDDLRSEVAALNSTPEHARAARQIELVELGIRLLEDATSCPLCDTPWEPERLRDHLTTKAARGRQAAPSWKKVRDTADSMLRWLSDKEETIARIVNTGRQGDSGSDPGPLTGYAQALGKLRAALADPLNLYISYREEARQLSEQLALSGARELLRSLYKERAQAARKDPVQRAWDTLTGLEKNLETLASAKKREESALKSANRLEAVRASFINARDKVLGELYNSVKDRFVALYRELHAPEEQDFDANLTPDDAGLTLEVDFYDTGKVAPFALHSDGHQDSMGLCLFLALAEHMQGTQLGFCLLDDVVMTIDAGHRLKVAKLLTSLKAQTQFLITTHDLTWVRQLQAEGCVSPKTSTRFIGWSLDGGPVEAKLNDFLGESESALAAGNVHTAAHALRYGLESFFHLVADSIGAQPPYSLSGQYEMGPMFIACSEQLKGLVKDARKAAQSWGQTEKEQALAEFEANRSAIRGNAQMTQWAVNPNVHFNSWMDMTADEFRPVLECFKELCKLFNCETCGSLLTLVSEGAKPTVVKCACGKVDWNLEKKPT